MRPEKLIGLRYMTRFRCIGAQCEDNCCRHWDVYLAADEHERVRSLVRTVRPHLASAIQPADDEGWAAKITRSDGINCALLEQRLCAIQNHAGASALPGACATFPRSIAQVADRCELSGDLSCPEAARLCLLAPDSTDFVELDWDALPPQALVTGLLSDAEEFDAVRSYALGLLSKRGYTIETRLGFMAWLACGRDPGAIDLLAQQLAGLAIPVEPALRAVEAALGRATRGPLGQLRAAALETHGGELALLGSASRYERRRDALAARHAARLALYVEAYAKNHWVRVLHSQSPSLNTYVRDLLFHLATIKFLLVSHPKLAEGSIEESVLDRCAVEVAQTYTKYAVRDRGYVSALHTQLDADGFTDLAHLLTLTRL